MHHRDTTLMLVIRLFSIKTLSTNNVLLTFCLCEILLVWIIRKVIIIKNNNNFKKLRKVFFYDKRFSFRVESAVTNRTLADQLTASRVKQAEVSRKCLAIKLNSLLENARIITVYFNYTWFLNIFELVSGRLVFCHELVSEHWIYSYNVSCCWTAFVIQIIKTMCLSHQIFTSIFSAFV